LFQHQISDFPFYLCGYAIIKSFYLFSVRFGSEIDLKSVCGSCFYGL